MAKQNKSDDSGWVAEIKIPYSALRFPDVTEQTWGLNIWRDIRRYRETDCWNFVDKKISGTSRQAGELTNLHDIRAPLRLSFTPYVSGYLQKPADQKTWDYTFNYGLDLKYGINESFTLDMTMIPDFGQVQSDDKIYNLSPFEVYYKEHRPFFIEGIELFDKGSNVFYTRRIGKRPQGYKAVYDSLQEGEYVSENPAKAKLINATKVSGRTRNGLGIGVFNAMTERTEATVVDSLGNVRTVETQPFSNYNMLVFDQNLKNNSYVSIYNTNVYRGRNTYTANVTGSEFQLYNKSSSYSLFGRLNVSQKYYPSERNDFGYNYAVQLEKISGNFRFSIYRQVKNDTYDPNDMGFSRVNNTVANELELQYNFYDPFGPFLSLRNSLSVWYEGLYSPRKYTEFGLSARSRVTFRNHISTGIKIKLKPTDQHDYYEARADGQVYIDPADYKISAYLSPDYRKAFVVDISAGYKWSPKYSQHNIYGEISPRFRVNDRLTFRLEVNIDLDNNNIGYVGNVVMDENDVIVFGRRNLKNVENILKTSYIFTNKLVLDFRLRHYWLNARYNNYYQLDEEGYLNPLDYDEDNNFDFNAFNIDMIVRWEFAPGSELALAWKNALLTLTENEAANKYIENLKHVLKSPSDNSFSLKVLYYLDYLYLKRKK